MTTLGESWKRQVSVNGENRQVLEAGIAQRELAAAQWVEQAQKTKLPQGIASCITRGSDSLALPLPTDIIATAPFRTFLDFLRSEGLLLDVAINGEGSPDSLLLISPQ